jgi:SAM-dependent methyltransferase
MDLHALRRRLDSLYRTRLTRLVGRRHPHQSLVPPDDVLRVAGIGGGDYLSVGREFLDYFRNLAELHRDQAVLEMGCGIGRMAVALTTYLKPPGRYDGFDVVRPSITWCESHITPRHPHFRFQFLDVANTTYNPGGQMRADQVAFPFPDATFDLVIAISLFTHVLPEGTLRYMTEARRVLRPGGRLFATWFVWRTDVPATPEALAFLPVDCGSYRVASAENPEAVVAFPEPHVLEMYERAQLRVTKTVRGNWARDLHNLPYQDMIIATKEDQIPGRS